MNRKEKAIRNERIKELRLQGYSNSAIAEQMGMKEITVTVITRNQGLSHVELRKEKRICEWCGNEFSTNHSFQKYCCLQCQRKAARESVVADDSHVNDMVHRYTTEWDYVRGYTNNDGKVILKHLKCGHEVEKSVITIRRIERRLECPYCDEKEREERQAEREAEKEHKRLEQERNRWEKDKRKRFKQISFSICECCGEMFSSNKAEKKYCSAECCTRANNAIHKDKRIKKMREKIVDRGITLEKLYERDGGICKICGAKCDWDDKYVHESGCIITGNSYPSIDHIKPLSKGGLHSWDNIQLTCRHCNSVKSDKEDIPLSSFFFIFSRETGGRI